MPATVAIAERTIDRSHIARALAGAASTRCAGSVPHAGFFSRARINRNERASLSRSQRLRGPGYRYSWALAPGTGHRQRCHPASPARRLGGQYLRLSSARGRAPFPSPRSVPWRPRHSDRPARPKDLPTRPECRHPNFPQSRQAVPQPRQQPRLRRFSPLLSCRVIGNPTSLVSFRSDRMANRRCPGVSWCERAEATGSPIRWVGRSRRLGGEPIRDPPRMLQCNAECGAGANKARLPGVLTYVLAFNAAPFFSQMRNFWL